MQLYVALVLGSWLCTGVGVKVEHRHRRQTGGKINDDGAKVDVEGFGAEGGAVRQRGASDVVVGTRDAGAEGGAVELGNVTPAAAGGALRAGDGSRAKDGTAVLGNVTRDEHDIISDLAADPSTLTPPQGAPNKSGLLNTDNTTAAITTGTNRPVVTSEQPSSPETVTGTTPRSPLTSTTIPASTTPSTINYNSTLPPHIKTSSNTASSPSTTLHSVGNLIFRLVS